MTEQTTPVEIDVEDFGRDLIDAGYTPAFVAEVERRLTAQVAPQFVAEVERDLFRTKDDTGSNSNALLVWNRVRAAAGMDRLTKDDLVRRTVDLYYDDAARAEARGDYANADRYRGIARTIMAENPKVYPPVETASGPAA